MSDYQAGCYTMACQEAQLLLQVVLLHASRRGGHLLMIVAGYSVLLLQHLKLM